MQSLVMGTGIIKGTKPQHGTKFEERTQIMLKILRKMEHAFSYHAERPCAITDIWLSSNWCICPLEKYNAVGEVDPLVSESLL